MDAIVTGAGVHLYAICRVVNGLTLSAQHTRA